MSNTTENNTTNTTTTPSMTAPVIKTDTVVREIPVVISRTEAAKREGKDGIAYWEINFSQFNVLLPDGKIDYDATLLRIGKLYGSARLIDDIISSKVNANLKASQLDAGKDKFTMTEKADYALKYIDADFGATSRGGGGLAAAFKGLQDMQAKQQAITKQLLELGSKLFNPSISVEDKVNYQKQFEALQVEAMQLANPKK